MAQCMSRLWGSQLWGRRYMIHALHETNQAYVSGRGWSLVNIHGETAARKRRYENPLQFAETESVLSIKPSAISLGNAVLGFSN